MVLNVEEGHNVLYGVVKFDTRPNTTVVVNACIMVPREGTPLFLATKPSHVVFNNTNWEVTLLFNIIVEEDFIDNDVDTEEYRILHYVSTTDSLFQKKAKYNLFFVRIEDNNDWLGSIKMAILFH